MSQPREASVPMLRVHAERCRAFLFDLDGVVIEAVAADTASAHPGTVDLLRRLRAAGVRTAVVSGGREAGRVLALAGLSDLIDARVDVEDAERLSLPARPDPATWLEAAHRLDVDPGCCVVVEHAVGALPADQRGRFGLVVDVDRSRPAATAAQHDRDVIAADLGEIRFLLTEAGCPLCATPPTGEWVLTYRDGDPGSQGIREALLTVGNGYMATRGAPPEACADAIYYPGTYVAGIYNRLVSDVDGFVREDESLVNLPNWLPLTFRPAGAAWFGPSATGPVHEHLALDLRRGVLTREVLVLDPEGRRTRLRQRRLVSMAAPHRAALEATVIPENWSGRLELRTALDARVTNSNVLEFASLAARQLRTTEAGTDQGDTMWLVAETSSSNLRVAQAASTRVRRGALEQRSHRRTVAEPDLIGQDVGLDVDQGEPITVDKSVSVYTSHDRAIFEPLTAARQDVADVCCFEEELAPHAAAWERLWRRFELDLEDGDEVKLSVNTYLFHLLQTISPHTAALDTGAPARGLHGEGYRGHVFWDELFVFPFLNFRMPELTRALLQYRHRRLPQARRHAAALGMKGAFFPWQSGSDGREETPARSFDPQSGLWMPDNSGRQYHVNLAVSYSAWHYWQTTADLGFMLGYGAELIIETARFWASLATYDPAADRYDIRGVMGPDEFHDGYPDRPGQGIDNSAYVNLMVAWTLARAREVKQLLDRHHGEELCQSLNLTGAEFENWDHIGRRLRVPFLPNGMIEQFEGHGRLAELDLDAYRARHGDLRRLGFILLAENDNTNRYQVSKQADVLMLLYLFTAEELTALIHHLGYGFDPAIIPAMVDHYLARSAEGSTLSRIADSWVLSRTNRRRSWQTLREALAADSETKGSTSREGIHLGAIAGTLDILQRCYTGLDTHDNVLWLNPLLPDELRRLQFDIRYRGHWITLRFDHFQMSVESHPGEAPPATLAVRETFYQLAPGDTITRPTPIARHAAQPV